MYRYGEKMMSSAVVGVERNEGTGARNETSAQCDMSLKVCLRCLRSEGGLLLVT